MRAVVSILVCALLFLSPSADARVRPHRSSSAVSTRHRLTVNSLVTDPGTFEWEWYGSSTPAVPTVWKVTPSAGDGFWGRTELSASFDAITRADGAIHTTDHLSLAATTALPSIGPLQLAFAPVVTFLDRADSGIRAGGLLLGKVDAGRHSAGFSTSWSGANRTSDTNPAGLFDVGGGYGLRTGAITSHINVTHEIATGYPSVLTVAGGVEWQARRNLAFDISMQSDHLVVGGLTWNLGRIRRR